VALPGRPDARGLQRHDRGDVRRREHGAQGEGRRQETEVQQEKGLVALVGRPTLDTFLRNRVEICLPSAFDMS
jgi:hypothetical protein